MNTIYDGPEVPGMIEPIEQALLRNIASEVCFDEGSCAVEFGSFFGRSTACISAGLSSNRSFYGRAKFYAYDSFECDLTGGFYPHVLSFAKASNKEHLLESRGSRVSFYPVFESYLGNYIKSGVLTPVIKELKDSLPSYETIILMHIDSPKFYGEFKYLLFRFFPFMKTGSLVVFQDFFYHWSATLIAACGLMIKEGIMTVEKSAASSLVCRISQRPTEKQINEIDLQMSSKKDIPNLIDYTIKHIDRIELDRRDVFLPRLYLAKMQWLYDSGAYRESTAEIARFFNQGNKLNNYIVRDFLELMENGFSTRRLYELDHP